MKNIPIRQAYEEYKDEGSFMGYRNNLLHFLWLYFIDRSYQDTPDRHPDPKSDLEIELDDEGYPKDQE